MCRKPYKIIDNSEMPGIHYLYMVSRAEWNLVNRFTPFFFVITHFIFSVIFSIFFLLPYLFIYKICYCFNLIWNYGHNVERTIRHTRNRAYLTVD